MYLVLKLEVGHDGAPLVYDHKSFHRVNDAVDFGVEVIEDIICDDADLSETIVRQQLKDELAIHLKKWKVAVEIIAVE